MTETTEPYNEARISLSESSDAVIRHFPNGMTVRELKQAIQKWPEINEYTGEECEVWLPTGDGLTSVAIGIVPMNRRENDGKISADLLFETRAFDV